VKAPLPYYIPEATISVASSGACPAVAATNPVFTAPSASKISSASLTTTEDEQGSASSTAESRASSAGTRTSVTGTSTSSEGAARQTATGAASRTMSWGCGWRFGLGIPLVLGLIGV
jgi:hypothetical protein